MSHEDFSKELQALRERLPEAVEEAATSKTVPRVGYTLELAERIIDQYAQGKSLHAIARGSEMPAYSTLLKWAKSHPEFSKMLAAVRTARALHFEDKAIAAAEEASGKDGDRLRFEAYKWGAEVNDPATYGRKVQATHEVAGKVTLQVVTGFGEPNQWQKSPKLKADGTIEREVISEVSDAPRSVDSEGRRGPPGEKEGRQAGEARPPDAARSGEYREPGGVPALPPESGQPPTDGSAESASVRGDQL